MSADYLMHFGVPRVYGEEHNSQPMKNQVIFIPYLPREFRSVPRLERLIVMLCLGEIDKIVFQKSKQGKPMARIYFKYWSLTHYVLKFRKDLIERGHLDVTGLHRTYYDGKSKVFTLEYYFNGLPCTTTFVRMMFDRNSDTV